jgi:putative transposase
VAPGYPFHITQRGNRREDIFFCDHDRLLFLEWLGFYATKYGLEIIAYCLMRNHIHLVAAPDGDTTLGELFRSLHTRYAMYLNRKQGHCGRVWQGRYFSAVLDENYLFAAIRYAEVNPVRAFAVRVAEHYRWSSAAAHCGMRDDPLLTTEPRWRHLLDDVPSWSDWLQSSEGPTLVDTLRVHTRRGHPCGSDAFTSRMMIDRAA